MKPVAEWPVDDARRLSFARLRDLLERSFLPQLLGAIRKELKLKKSSSTSALLPWSTASVRASPLTPFVCVCVCVCVCAGA